MDVKAVLGGKDCRGIIMYMTDYASKMGLSTHDMVPMMIGATKKFFGPSTVREATALLDSQTRASRLITMCLNSINVSTEVSAQQVAAFLSGKPDHFKSHTFSTLVYYPIKDWVENAWLDWELSAPAGTLGDAQDTLAVSMEEMMDVDQGSNNQPETAAGVPTLDEELFEVGAGKTGPVLVNTRIDYIFRSDDCSKLGLYEYAMWYRKQSILRDKRYNEDQDTEEPDHSDTTDGHSVDMDLDDESEGLSSVGVKRPRKKQGKGFNQRFVFTRDHPQHNSHRMIRRTSPVIPTLYPIPSTSSGNAETFALTMLVLFQPFRTPYDLKVEISESWGAALLRLEAGFTPAAKSHLRNLRNINAGIHQNAQMKTRLTDEARKAFDSSRSNKFHAGEELGEEFLQDLEDEFDTTDHGRSKAETKLDAFVQNAVLAAQSGGRFQTRDPKMEPRLQPSTSSDFGIESIGSDAEGQMLIKQFEQAMKGLKKRLDEQIDDGDADDGLQIDGDTPEARIGCLDCVVQEGKLGESQCDDRLLVDNLEATLTSLPTPESVARDLLVEFQKSSGICTRHRHMFYLSYSKLLWTDPPVLLNREQEMAYFLVVTHLISTIVNPNEPPPQLLGFVSGKAGTGKSMVINSIRFAFDRLKVIKRLALTAYCGKAAVLIGGCTLHSLVGIGLNTTNSENSKASAKFTVSEGCQSQLRHVDYIIIDEISTVGAGLFASVSAKLNSIKRSATSVPFGGCNVICFGDFSQLPPCNGDSLSRFAHQFQYTNNVS